MSKLEALKDRIKSGGDIQSVVRTMKSFAAVRIKQYQKVERTLGLYRGTVEDALSAIMRGNAVSAYTQKKSGRICTITGIIAMGSDQGLAGQFNDASSLFLKEMLSRKPQERPRVCVLGNRLVKKLEGHGIKIHASLSMPGSVSAIPIVLEKILAIIDEWQNECGIEGILLLHNRKTPGASCAPASRSLLPPDREWFTKLALRKIKNPAPPLVTISTKDLRRSLVSHYLYMELFEGLIESLCCENAMRLFAMQVAERHIADYLDELTLETNQERQTGITEELLDIVAGAEALEKGR